jgi:hypothetical protein
VPKAFQIEVEILFAMFEAWILFGNLPDILDIWCENKGNNVCRDTGDTLDMVGLKKDRAC